MKNPWDESPKPADLPDPELNPLMNPTLGKNLGRWAQVYFTNPPETRTQAVIELLRELDGEKSQVDVSNSHQPEHGDLNSRDETSNIRYCPHCRGANSREQKFCGICGASLVATPEPVAQSEAASSSARYSEDIPVPRGEDVEWLRDRSLGIGNESEGSSRKTWIFAGAALVLVLGAAAYLQFSSTSRAAQAPASTTSSDSVVSDPPPPTTDSTSQVPAATENQPAEAKTQPAPKLDTASKPSSRLERASTAAKETSPDAGSLAGTGSVPENGSREFAEAQRLLAARNPEVAARLLWKSVAKENGGAEVALADLYTRGEGVGKNCEQARLLLVAAAKKGVGDAAQKLRNLESSGCP